MPSRAYHSETEHDVDALLDTLSHHLRREIIDYFESAGDTATLDELVAHIEQRVPAQTPEKAELQLIHQHLPKLSTEGWIEYDPQENRVRYYGRDDAEYLLDDICSIF